MIFLAHPVLVVSVVVVIIVVVVVAVVLTRSSDTTEVPSTTPSSTTPSSSATSSPVGPGPPNPHDLNVNFVNQIDLEVDVGGDYNLTMLSNNKLHEYPLTSGFTPTAKEVKILSDTSFRVTFVFETVGEVQVTLNHGTVQDEHGNLNETDTVSKKIQVINPNPPPPVPTGEWEGLASTTVFGSGDGPWGNKPGLQISLDAVNSEVSHRMGAAVPWRVLCKQFGSKDDQVEKTVDSALGKNEEKACWLIQPVSKYMNEVKNSSDPNFNNTMLNGICTGDNCVDVNSDIAARDGAGQEFPAYLIVGFEGCGGDCKNVPDCVNGCLFGNNIIPGVECKFFDCTGPECDGIKVVQNPPENVWEWNSAVSSDFLNYSQPYALSHGTDWKATAAAGQRLNWCSGQNMHFDIALDVPYWNSLGLGDTAQLNSDTNVMVRYKRVKCDIAGDFNPNPSGGGGGYQSCPAGSWDTGSLECTNCTGTCIHPGDPSWPGSEHAKHACCRLSN